MNRHEMIVERKPAVGAPTDTATLGRYDSTVVVDSPADTFPQDAMAAIASSVHDLGKGLVTVGGPSSYGPGGWGQARSICTWQTCPGGSGSSSRRDTDAPTRAGYGRPSYFGKSLRRRQLSPSQWCTSR